MSDLMDLVPGAVSVLEKVPGEIYVFKDKNGAVLPTPPIADIKAMLDTIAAEQAALQALIDTRRVGVDITFNGSVYKVSFKADDIKTVQTTELLLNNGVSSRVLKFSNGTEVPVTSTDFATFLGLYAIELDKLI